MAIQWQKCLFSFLFSLFILQSSAIESGLASGPSLRRQLRAAVRSSDIARRVDGIRAVHSAELSYAESENEHTGKATLAAKVKIQSHASILMLEDIEQYLDGLQCTPSSIKLVFDTRSNLEAASRACESPNGAYVITSHAGCNSEGERIVYKINGVIIPDNGNTLTLQAMETTWKEAFPIMTVQLDHSFEPHSFRSHEMIMRRATSKTQTLSQTSSSAKTTSTVTDTITSVAIPLATSIIDTELKVPAIVDEVVPLPSLPFTVKCKNCSTTGNLIITKGEFHFGLDLLSGYVHLRAEDFTAHIELQSELALSQSFQLELFSISPPGLGVSLSGIGFLGLSFGANLNYGYSVDSPVSIGYGFDVKVPNNSSINIDLDDDSKSNAPGFANTTLSSIPFQANITGLSANLTTSLRPLVKFGFFFGSESAPTSAISAGAQIALSMGLPNLQATISQKNNVDANCNPLNSTAALNSSISDVLPLGTIPALLAEMGELVNFVPTVGLDMKFGASLDGSKLLKNFDIGTEVVIFTKDVSLPTGCFAFDAKETQFRPATSILAEKTSSVIAAARASATAGGDKGIIALGNGSAGRATAAPAVLLALGVLGAVLIL